MARFHFKFVRENLSHFFKIVRFENVGAFHSNEIESSERVKGNKKLACCMT